MFYWRFNTGERASVSECVPYEGRVFVKAGLRELFETLGEIAIERRWGSLGNMEEHAHGVHVRVGRLPLGQLDGRDAQ